MSGETATDAGPEAGKSPLPENPFAEGVRHRRMASPCTLVLFGATGDLTHKKLVPSLFNLFEEGHLPRKFALVGFARRSMDDAGFRAGLREAARERVRRPDLLDELWDRFAESIFYHRASFDDLDGYRALARRLDQIDAELGTGGNRLFYLSTAPSYFAPVVERLGEVGLSRSPAGGAGADSDGRRDPSWVRTVIEKPFGTDLATARRLNRSVLAVLDESQVYRIDHYLGKETVQNILAFRFANGIFEPIWNYKYIDHVQITVAEDGGIEDRGPYYEAAGAARDMVQNHMMQLLSLVAMEPPASLDADAVRDEKVKVLRALRPLRGYEALRDTVRGQYAAGSILGQRVRGYREEDRVAPESLTPTYAALKISVENWRWAGVPFFLRHGKRLPKRASEIAIQFQKPPMRLFSSTTASEAQPNLLVLNIQPDDGISLCFGSKVPGPDIRIRQVKMDFRYGRSFGVASPDAYERLLLDAMAGDSTLFTRRDEVEHSWAFVDGVLEAWQSDGPAGLRFYPAGTWGPEDAEGLLGAGREWRRL